MDDSPNATIALQERHEEIAFVTLTVHLKNGRQRKETILYTNMENARNENLRSLRDKLKGLGCH